MPKISVEVPQRRLDARRRRIQVAPPLLSQSPAAPLGVRPRVRRCLPRLGLEEVLSHKIQDPKLDLSKDGAALIVNPMTAHAMLHLVKDAGAKAFVMTAGPSQPSPLRPSPANSELKCTMSYSARASRLPLSSVLSINCALPSSIRL